MLLLRLLLLLHFLLLLSMFLLHLLRLLLMALFLLLFPGLVGLLLLHFLVLLVLFLLQFLVVLLLLLIHLVLLLLILLIGLRISGARRTIRSVHRRQFIWMYVSRRPIGVVIGPVIIVPSVLVVRTISIVVPAVSPRRIVFRIGPFVVVYAGFPASTIWRWVVVPAFARRHHSASAERAGPLRSRDRRLAMIL